MTLKSEEQEFDDLLFYLQQFRSIDLTGYKKTSLMRRIRKQMTSHHIESISGYLDYLQVNSEALIQLINTVFINVTTFCRDPLSWQYLRDTILPTLLLSTSENDTVRLWSAGCSSGQEAYTIAMLLLDFLGPEEFHRRIKIYATDIDNSALSQARQAIYSEKELQDIPSDWKAKYFEPQENHFSVHSDIRQKVIFGCHNLLKDAPISHLDLLICRNTLMYFNPEAQAKIINRFHFSLNERGILFLGKAEILLNHSDLFSATNLRHRVFRRVSKRRLRERTLAITALANAQSTEMSQSRISSTKLRDIAFNTEISAQILVNNQGYLVAANAQARELFSLETSDEGRLLQDLTLSYRPIELRSLIEQVATDHSPTIISNISWMLSNNSIQYFDIHLSPLKENNTVLGTSIIFRNVTHYHLLRQELQHTNQELERANEELHSSNEELETTNEELQSTNEELENSNEALQLTNEELDTINEKLQLTNEELVRATRQKDEFMANVSHELRTPLNAILGLTESLEEGVYGPLSDSQVQPLKIIHRSGTHLLTLISDILDLTKIEAGQVDLDLNFISINRLCQSALDLVQHQARKKQIQITSQIPSNLPELLLDERRIRQSLVNLLNNAVKFTSDNGFITMNVHVSQETHLNRQQTDEDQQRRINISVTDNGIGIASEHIDQLFQPFSQVDNQLSRPHDGLGLGLYLVKQIITLHGGDVSISSQLGKGSCFTISIPCITRPRIFPSVRD